MSARRGDGIARLVYQFTARAVATLLRTFGDVRRSFERWNFPPAQRFLCTTHGAWRPVCRRNEVIVLRWWSGTATVNTPQIRRRFPWHSFVIL